MFNKLSLHINANKVIELKLMFIYLTKYIFEYNTDNIIKRLKCKLYIHNFFKTINNGDGIFTLLSCKLLGAVIELKKNFMVLITIVYRYLLSKKCYKLLKSIDYSVGFLKD